MLLIEMFTDHVVNKKSLVDYIELRKSINERGEFSDSTLLKAQNNLDRLKTDDSKTYNEMYKILKEIMELDTGHSVEYPIDFIKEILKMYKLNTTAVGICKDYKEVLTHHYQDA